MVSKTSKTKNASKTVGPTVQVITTPPSTTGIPLAYSIQMGIGFADPKQDAVESPEPFSSA